MSSDKTQIVEIGEVNFEVEVLQSKQPVLVAFFAPWSRACQPVRPVLDEIATACAGMVKVVKVNADNNPDLGLWYEIQSIPALLYFVGGSLRGKVIGTVSKEAVFSQLRMFSQDNASVSPISDSNTKNEYHNG
ncbi:MAG TPA: thioredoxin domain-containing protein [Candidatus Acidoferrales bacterium]|jgi:thioredoxin 1|nr:thioredoxin domain-containing protein [Candidatus Acidoferrales bacterium]